MLPLRARVDLGVMAMKGFLNILQSAKIGASPSDCIVSYPGHALWGGGLTSLQRCSRCILQPKGL